MPTHTVAELRTLSTWPGQLVLDVHIDLDPGFSVMTVRRTPLEVLQDLGVLDFGKGITADGWPLMSPSSPISSNLSDSFYRTHCRVCEEPIEQPGRGERLICRKAVCIRAFRESSDTYRYQVAQTTKSISETPDFIDSKQPLKPDRGWFIVAGPELTQFHCAIVGAREAVDGFAVVNAAHWRAATAGERGYRRPDAVTVEAPASSSTSSAKRRAMLPIPDDLSIPAFLDRRPNGESSIVTIETNTGTMPRQRDICRYASHAIAGSSIPPSRSSNLGSARTRAVGISSRDRGRAGNVGSQTDRRHCRSSKP